AHLPRGIPYTFKIMLQSVRKCIKHFDLKEFVFMSHSYGVGLSLFYQTIFPGEVKANVALDWIFSFPYSMKHDFAQYLKQGIDQYMDYEQEEMNADKIKATQAKRS